MIKKKFIFVVNQVTFWEKLPWHKINMRILMIKKQIYIAMKKHDLTYVYQLQKYIMNSNEVKVSLINKILCDLVLYYNNCSNIKLLIRSINKFDILNSLVINKSKRYVINNVIIEYIKQNLIYISIEPTWTAKISKKLTQLINNTQITNSVSSYKKRNNKYFLTKIIINRLGSYNYINKSISLWLYQNICLNLSKIHNLKYKKCVIENRNNELKFITKNLQYLQLLINSILINDLYWYKFHNIRKKNSVWKHMNNKKIVILHKNIAVNKSLKIFNTMLKKLLYRKTYKGFNKINVFDNNIINKFKFLYRYYYSHVTTFISLSLIENYNELINVFNYVIIKKQISQNLNKSKYFYNLQLVNQLLNKYIYFCNIEYFY
uniref:hypothetical protein orf375 n=1 Tax=Deltalsia parasitica TaxID=1424640 RepID=UPI0022FD99F5|nr:hypothetical protein orf375 [Deltalsia parasitica]WAX02883.1 hypothetical protein orf375 [Deltalsia parasitica]